MKAFFYFSFFLEHWLTVLRLFQKWPFSVLMRSSRWPTNFTLKEGMLVEESLDPCGRPSLGGMLQLPLEQRQLALTTMTFLIKKYFSDD
jgi:hypothetical protein